MLLCEMSLCMAFALYMPKIGTELYYVFSLGKLEMRLCVVTLCVCAQQVYVFSRISLCTYIYVYSCIDKKTGYLVPYMFAMSC